LTEDVTFNDEDVTFNDEDVTFNDDVDIEENISFTLLDEALEKLCLELPLSGVIGSKLPIALSRSTIVSLPNGFDSSLSGLGISNAEILLDFIIGIIEV
jgi:hypothetical protein